MDMPFGKVAFNLEKGWRFSISQSLEFFSQGLTPQSEAENETTDGQASNETVRHQSMKRQKNVRNNKWK